jgi:hypothetical protein
LQERFPEDSAATKTAGISKVFGLSKILGLDWVSLDRSFAGLDVEAGERRNAVVLGCAQNDNIFNLTTTTKLRCHSPIELPKTVRL